MYCFDELRWICSGLFNLPWNFLICCELWAFLICRAFCKVIYLGFINCNMPANSCVSLSAGKCTRNLSRKDLRIWEEGFRVSSPCRGQGAFGRYEIFFYHSQFCFWKAYIMNAFSPLLPSNTYDFHLTTTSKRTIQERRTIRHQCYSFQSKRCVWFSYYRLSCFFCLHEFATFPLFRSVDGVE